MACNKKSDALFLGIDQGSSSSKSCLIDLRGKILQSGEVSVKSFFKDGGIVEQNPVELLFSVVILIEEAKKQASKAGKKISAIGLSTQRSGVMAWSSNRVEHALITWRDSRLKGELESLEDKRPIIKKRCGLPLTVHYSGSKIAFLQRAFKAKNCRVGTLESFLIEKLTGNGDFVCDESAAARSMLYNLQTRCWDRRLCEIFGVDLKLLPEIRPVFSKYGSYEDMELTAVMGDQQAAAFGLYTSDIQGVLILGTVGSLIVFSSGRRIYSDGFITNLWFSDKKSCAYNLEGTTNACGSVVDLIIKKLKFAENIKEIDKILKSFSGDRRALAYYPLGGTGSPYWRTDLRPVVVNWSKESREDLIRALVENIGNFIAFNIEQISRRTGMNIKKLAVTGGGAAFDYLLQYISDASGCMLERKSGGSALGAAVAAASGIDKMQKDSPVPADKQFIPRDATVGNRFKNWKKLQKKVIKKGSHCVEGGICENDLFAIWSAQG